MFELSECWRSVACASTYDLPDLWHVGIASVRRLFCGGGGFVPWLGGKHNARKALRRLRGIGAGDGKPWDQVKESSNSDLLRAKSDAIQRDSSSLSALPNAAP